METSLINKNKALQSHFYNTTYEAAKKEIIEFLKSRLARLDGVSDEFLEITAHDYVYDITFIFHEEDYLKIDLLVIAPLLYNKKKYIKEIYNFLNSKFELVRIGEEL